VLVPRSALLAATLVLVACARGTPAPPALPAIPEVVSHGGVAALTLTAAYDAQQRPAFFWQGTEVAPTVRVRPGDLLEIQLVNHLPATCGLGMASNSNLHFHGFNSAPVPPGDEVILTNAAPGRTIAYRVRVPRTQPPGLYWYHPHAHGLASWEVGNGMAGAIVVEGIGDALPELVGLRERVIVLRDPPTDPSIQNVTRELAETHKEAALSARMSRGQRRAMRQQEEAEESACAPETDGAPTINGVPRATIGIRSGERELLRVVNASAHRHFVLALNAGTLRLVGQDGVPLGYLPGAPRFLDVPWIVVPPAGRVDLVLTGAPERTQLLSKCYYAGRAGDPNPQVVLADLHDDRGRDAALDARVARIGLAPVRSFYRTPLPPPARRRTIRFEEDARSFKIDGVAYRPDEPAAIVARSGTVEEWTIENDTDENHVFHIHQAHFVLESINGYRFPERYWLDTVDVPQQSRRFGSRLHAPSRAVLLIDFRDPTIRGTFLFHCHILDHEDGGMMAKITVR
jgi:FtsP/CotA-like multicopper oxidase with cupredoxin domain